MEKLGFIRADVLRGPLYQEHSDEPVCAVCGETHGQVPAPPGVPPPTEECWAAASALQLLQVLLGEPFNSQSWCQQGGSEAGAVEADPGVSVFRCKRLCAAVSA